MIVKGDDYAEIEGVDVHAFATFALRFNTEDEARLFSGAHVLARQSNGKVVGKEVSMTKEVQEVYDEYLSSEYASNIDTVPSPVKVKDETPSKPKSVVPAVASTPTLPSTDSSSFGNGSSSFATTPLPSFGNNTSGVSTMSMGMNKGSLSFGSSTKSVFGASTTTSSGLSSGSTTFGSSNSKLSFGTPLSTTTPSTSLSSFGMGNSVKPSTASSSTFGNVSSTKDEETADEDIEADKVDINQLKLPTFEGLDKEIEVVKGDEDEDELIKL